MEYWKKRFSRKMELYHKTEFEIVIYWQSLSIIKEQKNKYQNSLFNEKWGALFWISKSISLIVNVLHQIKRLFKLLPDNSDKVCQIALKTFFVFQVFCLRLWKYFCEKKCFAVKIDHFAMLKCRKALFKNTRGIFFLEGAFFVIIIIQGQERDNLRSLKTLISLL